MADYKDTLNLPKTAFPMKANLAQREPQMLKRWEELDLYAKIRAARERQGLTWYAVAKAAKIPNPATVRDIEYGRDTKLSSIEAIAEALGLKLDLVEAEV